MSVDLIAEADAATADASRAAGLVEATERLYRVLFTVTVGYATATLLWGVVIAPFNIYDDHPVLSMAVGVLLALATVPALRHRVALYERLRREPRWLLAPTAVGAALLWIDTDWRSVYYLASYSAIVLAAVVGGLRWSFICAALLALNYLCGLLFFGVVLDEPGPFKEPDSAVANTGGYLIAAYFFAAPVAWLGGYVARINQVVEEVRSTDAGAAPTPEPSAQPERVRTGKLSAREVQVVLLVAAGETNPEIAGRLVVSPHTVQRHLERIMRTTGVRNRTQLAVLAVAEGLAPAAVSDTREPNDGQ